MTYLFVLSGQSVSGGGASGAPTILFHTFMSPLVFFISFPPTPGAAGLDSAPHSNKLALLLKATTKGTDVMERLELPPGDAAHPLCAPHPSQCSTVTDASQRFQRSRPGVFHPGGQV